MAVDLHTAGEQREGGGVVPDGTYVRLQMVINPGGVSIPSPDGDQVQDQLDMGIYTQSASSDAQFLECEMTVLGPPPWQNHKLTERMILYGGKSEKDGSSISGNISRAFYRAMINSACGLNPKDDTPQAQQTRLIRGYMDLSGIEFWARLWVEPGSPAPNGGFYADKNRLDHVVVPGEPEYAALVAGQEVPPQPTGRGARVPTGATATAAPAGVGRAWGAAAPAAAPAQPAPAQPANKWATPTQQPSQPIPTAASHPVPSAGQVASQPVSGGTGSSPMPTRWMQPKT